MIKQLREFYTPEELAAVYARPYDHRRWEDHKIRVAQTLHHARWLRDHVSAQSAADLSCGDGAILAGLHMPAHQTVFGDYVKAPHVQWVGDVEDSHSLNGINVDLYICSETLEHLRDPGGFLTRLRWHTWALLLTTPEGEDNAANPEHYWGWDSEGVETLLRAAGFNPVFHSLLNPGVPGAYTHQVWGCV